VFLYLDVLNLNKDNDKKYHKAILEPVRKLFPINGESENNYYIYACNIIKEIEGHFIVGSYGNITLLGTMPLLDLYQQYTITCIEEESKKYKGKQYVFVTMEQEEMPKSKEQQIRFFSSLLTPLQVENIFKVYDSPIDEFVNDTFEYEKVHGFGLIMYEKVKKRILEHYVLFELLAELSIYGINFGQIVQLYNKYKDAKLILEKINNNPYVLMELSGVAFEKADAIAIKMGLLKNDPRRIKACIEFCLSNEENDGGHTWTDIKTLERKVKGLTGRFDKKFNELIQEHEKDFIIVDGNKVALLKAYNTEVAIKEHLFKIQNDDNSFKQLEILGFNIYSFVEEFIKEQEEVQGFLYNDAQKQGFYNMIENNVSLIIGYAGTGKSTLVNGLLNFIDKLNASVREFLNKYIEENKDNQEKMDLYNQLVTCFSYVLLSPTAKACKVLSSYTFRNAYTYERGMCWTPTGYLYNEFNPMPYNVVINDENSMVGIYKFLLMLKAQGSSPKIFLIGDTAQLESIEAGAVLNDIMNSKLFPVTELTEVHRQSLDSGIIEIATNVRLGRIFISNNEKRTQFYGVNKDAIIIPGTKEKTLKNIIGTYKLLLKKGYKQDEIAVILPMKKGESGTREVNRLLQELNNPLIDDIKEIKYGKKFERIYRENDLVMNVINDYKIQHYDCDLKPINGSTGVINGDGGYIYKIIGDIENGKNIYIAVFIDGHVILYPKHSFDMLEHSWAFSIHKSQGSSIPVVIMGLDSRHSYNMAKRSILYTGSTRASKLFILCGDPEIINKAIKNNQIIHKRTFLKDLLLKESI